MEDAVDEENETLWVTLRENAVESAFTLDPIFSFVTIIDDDELPGAPTGLTVDSVGTKTVNLSWAEPADTGGNPISGYLVEWAENASGPWSTVEPPEESDSMDPMDTDPTATKITHAGLTPQTTYHYRVTAITGTGPSDPSTSVSATTNPLPVMTLSVPMVEGVLQTSVGEKSPALFLITRTGDDSEKLIVNLEWSQDGSDPIAVTDTLDVGEQEDFYPLSTRDNIVDEDDGTITLTLKAGEGYTLGATTSVTITVVDDDERPEAPVLTARADDEEVELTWDKPAAGTSEINRYDYHLRESSATAWSSWTDTGVDISLDALTLTIGSLTNGTSYDFEVRATSDAGDGPESNTATATPTTGPTITAIAILSTPSLCDGRAYAYTDTVQIGVTFSEAVTVDTTNGTPYLSLRMADYDASAAYSAPDSSATQLVFTKTIANTDFSGIGGQSFAVDDPADHSSRGLQLNGATIRSSASMANAVLTGMARARESNAHMIGILMIGVTMTSTPASGNTYAIGEQLALTATFNRTYGGRDLPDTTLTLAIGDGTRQAQFHDAGPTTMDFTYDIAEGDTDGDGVGVAADAMDLAGGSLGTPLRSHRDFIACNEAIAMLSSDKVDGVRPTLVTTAPDAPATSADGTQILLTFDEELSATTAGTGDFAVTVSGMERAVTGVAVDADDNDLVKLTLGSAVGDTDTITVAYTDPSPDNDANALQDGAGNDVESFPGVAVANNAPAGITVSTISLTSMAGTDQTYAIDDTVTATVTMSEAMSVSGTPQLELDVGATPKTAACSLATDTTKLACAYTVAKDDEDTDGVSIGANKLSLNGASITKASGDAGGLVLAHGAVTAQSGHKVDGVRPTVTGASADGTTLTVRWSERLNTTAPAPGKFILSVDSGTAPTVSAASITGATLTLTLSSAISDSTKTYTLAYAVPSSNRIQDLAGNDALAVTAQAIVVATDASLSALALSVGADAVTLSPAFASTTTDYTAMVANTVGTVTLTATTRHDDATVAYADGSGTPLADADTTAEHQQVTLAVGANTIRVVVTAPDAMTTQTYEIVVTRALPVVSIETARTPVVEAADTVAELTLTRSGDTDAALAVTVNITTGDGGVFGGLAADLTAFPREAEIAIGASTATLTYAITDDDVVHDGGYTDGDDFVTVTLVAGTGYTVSESAGAATVGFEDDDELDFAFTATPDSVEEGESVVLKLAGTNGKSYYKEVTGSFLFSSGSADFSDVNPLDDDAFTLAAEATSVSKTMTIDDDVVVEGEEQFSMVLQMRQADPFGSYDVPDTNITITIEDNDVPEWTVSVSETTIAENGGVSELTLDTGGVTYPSGQNFTFDGAGSTATLGSQSDFELAPIPMVLAPRKTTATATITALDDDVDEADEKIVLRVGFQGETGTVGDAVTVTITDDDTRGVTVTPETLTVDEAGDRTYTVVLDSKPTEAVTVTPTVTGDSDVTVSPPELVFAPTAWDTAQAVTVRAAADADTTDDTATVSHAVTGGDYEANSVAAASVTVTVTDDHTPPTVRSRTLVETIQAHFIQVVYDEVLAADSIPGSGAFEVKVEGTTVALGSVSRSQEGEQLLIQLPNNVRPGETVTLSYTRPGTDALKDAAGNEAASFTDRAVTNNLAATAPEAPGSLAATAVADDPTKMDLAWTTPWDNGDAITRFEVRHAAGTSVPTATTWTAIDGSGAATTSHQVSGLDAATEYTFEVRAVNGIGNGAEASITSTTTLALAVDTIATDDTVNIAEKAAGFTITGNTGSEAGVSVTVTVGSTTLTAATSALVSGTATWSVAVPANASYVTGTSVQVSVSASKTGFPSPSALKRTLAVDLTAPALSGARSTGDGAKIVLTFSESIGSVDRTKITVKSGTTTLTTTADSTNGATVELTLTTALTASDTSVTVELSAGGVADAVGNPNAAISATPVPRIAKPAAPVLTAAAKDSSIELTWTLADHGGADITRYDYRIRETAGAAFSDSDWTDTGLTPANTGGTFTIGSLSNGTDYTVQVRAINSEGESPASNEVSATPDSPPEVDSVAITSDAGTDNTYAIGDDIVVTVTFDKNISLSGTGTDPVHALRLGADTTEAVCTVGTAPTTNLVCTYTVRENDEDHDGIEITGVTVTAGKTIVGPLGQEADTTHAGLAANASHKVDGVLPIPTGASADGMTLTLTWDEPLNTGSTPAGSAFTLTVDSGTAPTVDSVSLADATATLTLSAAVDATKTYTLTYAVPMTNPIEDAAGNDAEGFENRSVSTIELEWDFTITTSDTSNDGDNPVIVEGGETATVTATITNPGYTPPIDVTIDLRWDGTHVGGTAAPGKFLTGAGTDSTMTILSGQTSASVTISAVDDALFNPTHTAALVATYLGTEIDSVDLTVEDDEARPEVTITIDPNRVSESESAQLQLSVTPEVAVGFDVAIEVRDAGSALSTTPATTQSFVSGQTRKDVTIDAADNAAQDPTRTVTVEVKPNADYPWYRPGTPARATLTVLDDDTPPPAPPGFKAKGGNTQAVLTWNAPPRTSGGEQPIERYEVRWKETAAAAYTVMWTSVGTARTYTVTGLTNKTPYTFQVRAKNVAGYGPNATATATPTERPPVVELSPGAELEEGDAVTLTITPPDSPYESDTTLTVALVSVAKNQGVAPGPVAGTDYTVAVGDTELAPRYHRFDPAGDLASGPQPHYALTLTAGELSTAVTLTAIDDQEPEGQEFASIHVLEDGAELNGSGDGFRIAASDLRPEPASATVAGNTVTLTFSRGLRLIEDPGESDGDPDDTWIPLAPEMYFTRFTGDEAPVFDENHQAAPAPGQPEGQIASGFSLRGGTVTLTFPDPVSASENVWIAYHQYNAYAPLGDGSGDPDGRPVRKFLVKVQSAAALQVADAEAAEADLSADFAVTLDGQADGPVTVDYATADGTAQAGADYTATLGTLTFTPGRTALTIAVPVHDDGVNEGAETFTLTLSNAAGAVLADAEATGTIVNDDPLPRAWLARFGRIAAGHVLDAVAARLQGDHAAESQATIAGHALSAPAGEQADAAAREAWERAWDGRVQEEPRTMPFQQLLAGSSFHLALPAAGSDGDAAGAAGAEENGWTVWGRTAWTQFTGADAGLDLDGEVLTATAGADYAWDRLLAGLAVAYSTGAGTYRHAPSGDSGELRTVLLGVHPYLQLTLHERLAVWGVFGYAVLGDLSVQGATTDADTGAGMLMGAGGVRATLLDAADTGSLELTATADGLLLRVRSDPAPGLLAATADVQRLRLLLRASHHGVPVLGGLLTPAVEIGGRYDGGDAETGAGLVGGGSLSYSVPAWGLTLTAAGQGLLVHEKEGFREWGVAGTVLFDPAAPGRGIALRVVPSWGTAAAGGGERLWSLADASALAATDRFHPAARLDAELSYGLDAPGGDGTLLPYAAVALAAAGDRTWRLGSRLSIDPGFSLSLEGTRTEPAGAAAPDDSVTLKLTLRF